MITAILTSPASKTPMISHQRVEAIAGKLDAYRVVGHVPKC